MFKQVRRWLESRRTPGLPLTRADLTMGRRVRVRQDIDIFPHCIVRKGKVGTVSYVNPEREVADDDIIAEVTMDEYYPDLKEWDNAVHILKEDCGPAAPSDLEAL